MNKDDVYPMVHERFDIVRSAPGSLKMRKSPVRADVDALAWKMVVWLTVVASILVFALSYTMHIKRPDFVVRENLFKDIHSVALPKYEARLAVSHICLSLTPALVHAPESILCKAYKACFRPRAQSGSR
jgi:hypothetical protein